MKIDDYIERCRLARPFLAGTPREIPPFMECDLWWWFVSVFHEGDHVIGFFEREDAERAAHLYGMGLVDEPRHIRMPVDWRVEHAFDDGVSVLSGLPSEGRWTNPREIFFRADRWVPCEAESESFFENEVLRDAPSERSLVEVARRLNCDSVEEASARIHAARLIERITDLGGNTLALAIEMPNLVEKTERALAVLGVEKVTPQDLLAGTHGHFHNPLRRYHRDHSWSLAESRLWAVL